MSDGVNENGDLDHVVDPHDHARALRGLATFQASRGCPMAAQVLRDAADQIDRLRAFVTPMVKAPVDLDEIARGDVPKILEALQRCRAKIISDSIGQATEGFGPGSVHVGPPVGMELLKQDRTPRVVVVGHNRINLDHVAYAEDLPATESQKAAVIVYFATTLDRGVGGSIVLHGQERAIFLEAVDSH